MAEVTDELREHAFDGIREYDNPLPSWWLGIFYVTIAFGIGYVPWIHMTEGNTIAAEYNAEVAAALEKYGSGKIEWDAATLETTCATDGWKAVAEKAFAEKCVACHRADGGGLVGPAFTDDYYIHGGRLVDIAHTITVGVPAKGMISWGKILKQEQIAALACKVRSFRGQPVDKPKAPQGKKAEPMTAPSP